MKAGRRSFRATEVLLIFAAIVFAATSITQTVLCTGVDTLECALGAFGDRRPLVLEVLRIAGAVLLAGAWLVLVFTRPWRWWVRLLAALPSVLTLVDLVLSMQPPMVVDSGDESVSTVVMPGFSAGIEIGAVVALLAILTTSSRGVDLSRTILLLIASTSAGYLHAFIGGVIASAVGARPWPDAFTGGFVTAASIAIPTVISIALGFVKRRSSDEQTSPVVLTAPRAGGFLLTELLLIAASGVVVWVTYLGWVPCAGSMLEGTQFDPTPHDWNFSKACHEAMDHGDGFPISSWLESPLQQTVNGLNAIALLLLGVAWLLLVRNWGIRGRIRILLASLPGLFNLWLAVVATAAFIWPPAETPTAASITILLMDVAGFIGAIVLLTASPTSLSADRGIRVILVTLAVTAPSLGHLLTDYIVMTGFSEANWDSPPGTGYPTAFSIALFALLSMIVGVITRLWTNLRPSPLLEQPVPAG